MKIKTLLLGSAAAMLVAGGAQAADLSIGAEPVDYVRVCDAFGVGYWYIPGTDTCIKIGGEVNFSARFREAGWTTGAASSESWTPFYYEDGEFYAYQLSEDYVGGHSSHFRFQTEANVHFTAKSMTEYGALVGYVKLAGTRGTAGLVDDGVVRIDEAYLSLGHVLFGYTGSAANWDEGYAPGAWRGDTKANQIKLSWAAAGFGLQLGIEDPIGRWGTQISGNMEWYTGSEFAPFYTSSWDWGGEYHSPDITGNITLSQGHFNAKLVAGWTHQVRDMAGYDGSACGAFFGLPDCPSGYTSVYGVAGTLEAVMGDFKLRGGAGFGTGNSYLGLSGRGFYNGDQMWTAYISGLYQLTSTFSAAATYAIAGSNNPSIDGVHLTALGGKLVWAPVAGFEAYTDGKLWKYSDDTDHTWEWKVGAKRSW